jgi:hypothetical protein
MKTASVWSDDETAVCAVDDRSAGTPLARETPLPSPRGRPAPPLHRQSACSDVAPALALRATRKAGSAPAEWDLLFGEAPNVWSSVVALTMLTGGSPATAQIGPMEEPCGGCWSPSSW